MSILQRQLRIFLAAFLVAGLLLTGIATGQAAAMSCADEGHHGMTAASAHVGQVESSDTGGASGPHYDLAGCCSVSATTCCASAAIRCDDAVAVSLTPVRPAWLAAAAPPLHGLGHEVNRRPPRLA
jgi:hypothetical protein